MGPSYTYVFLMLFCLAYWLVFLVLQVWFKNRRAKCRQQQKQHNQQQHGSGGGGSGGGTGGGTEKTAPRIRNKTITAAAAVLSKTSPVPASNNTNTR